LPRYYNISHRHCQGLFFIFITIHFNLTQQILLYRLLQLNHVHSAPQLLPNISEIFPEINHTADASDYSISAIGTGSIRYSSRFNAIISNSPTQQI